MAKINIGGVDYTAEQVQALINSGLLGSGQKNDPASTSLGNTSSLQGYLQGSTTTGGVFSAPGVRPERFSAMPYPRTWLPALQVLRSEYDKELLEIQTGQTAGGSTNATGFCGNPPEPGSFKVAQQVYKWGSWYEKTQLNALANIGSLVDRAESAGSLLNYGGSPNPFIPDIARRITDTRNQLQYQMALVGMDIARTLELVSWQGVQGTDANRTGWFSEFNGMDSLIKTGYTDAVSGTLAPALDSIVESFSANLSGTDATGRNIVEVINDVWYGLNDRASQVGMDGVEWAIVMRKEQFRALVDVYACNYATYRCQTGGAGDPQTQMATETQRFRLEMLTGQYLLIDGVRVPVLFSEGIVIDRPALQTYTADMYFVPLSWNGRPLTYLQYFAMDNQYTTQFASLTGASEVTTLNNGLYLVGRRSTGLCLEYHLQSKMRLILETPFLAGRIDSVTFSYYAGTRVGELTPTYFYQNGGVSYRSNR